MARKASGKSPKSPGLGVTYTPDGFAQHAHDEQIDGLLPPFPVPPAPVPGDWWAQAFAAWLRAQAASFGPIVIRLP